MGCGGSKPEGGSGSQRQQPPHLWVGEVRKFTFTSNGKRYGMRLGALGDRVHDPYRCNGGGIEGEYGQATQLVVCSPEKATTLFWSQQYPHVNKLLINYQRHRCINVHWWKLVEGTACSIYDAYPTGPATGQKWIINSDGSISQHEERHLVLGLANHHSGWDVVKLVKAGAPSAILLDSPAPAAAFEGKLDGEWVGDYHEYGKERVRIDYVASESGTTICATKITGDHIVAAGMVTWEVPMGSTKGRANCGQHGWCDGDLIIRGPDHIAFRWPIWKTVEYKRAENYSPPLSGYNEDRGGCDIKVRYQRVTEPEEPGEGSGGGSGTEVTKPTALTEPTCPKCARTIIYWRNDLWTCDVCSKQMTPGSAGTWWCPTKTDGCDWGCCKSCYETLSGRLFNADGTPMGIPIEASASLYSPATSCHLANDGSLGASAEPAPYTLEFEGPPGDGVKFRLRAPDGRYLRSDGREGTPPQWSSAADALTTAWILRVDGDPFSSSVQLKSPGNGGDEPCLCNDQPMGDGRPWSWCPEGRGDAYWKLVRSDEPLAEVSP